MDWKGNKDSEEAKAVARQAAAIGLDPELDHDWDDELVDASPTDKALWFIKRKIRKVEKSSMTWSQKEALLKTLNDEKAQLLQQKLDENSKWAAPPSMIG